MHTSTVLAITLVPSALIICLIALLIFYLIMRQEQRDVVDLVDLKAKGEKVEQDVIKEKDTEPFPLFNPMHANIGEDEILRMPINNDPFSQIPVGVAPMSKPKPFSPGKKDVVITKPKKANQGDKNKLGQGARIAASNIFNLRSDAISHDEVYAASSNSTTRIGRGNDTTTTGKEFSSVSKIELSKSAAARKLFAQMKGKKSEGGESSSGAKNEGSSIRRA